MSKLQNYAKLARLEKPIGWELLLWPCIWSLTLAAETLAQLSLTAIIFLCGAITMRGAGCTYNDIVDRKIDAKVARTATRPLASGKINLSGAIIFLLCQLFISLLVLLFLVILSPKPIFTFAVAMLSIPIVLIYPFAKRFTSFAQFFLGICFSWGIVLGWVAINATLPFFIFLFYIGCIFWVMGYDTIYALQDIDDDALLGLHSTAIFFGKKVKLAIGIFYLLTTIFFAAAFYFAGVNIFTFLFFLLASCQLIYQIIALKAENSDICLRLFRSNSYFGFFIFFALFLKFFI